MRSKALLLSSLLLPLSWLTAGGSNAAQEDDAPNALYQSMQTLNAGLRDLRGALLKEDLDALFATLDQVELAIVTGKGQVPETVAAVAEDQREAFVRDFRLEQLQLLERMLQFEKLVLDGELTEAEEFLKTEIYAMKRPSHSRFKQEGGWTPR
ncbi:MAG: hypothetical protein AAFZ65_03655 [Planctomycetota bacterium]